MSKSFRRLLAALVLVGGAMYATPTTAQEAGGGSAIDAVEGGGVAPGGGDGEAAFAEDGYVWHGNGSVSLTYTSGTDYNYNPSGGDITVDRTAVGKYTVEFVGTTFLLPTVTGYNSDGNHCKIENYLISFVEVNVGCYDSAGNPVDEEFSMRLTTTFEDATALVRGSDGLAVNSLNNPWGASPTATKLGTGEYTVTTPGGPNFEGGHIQVTAYGVGESIHCKVDSWSSTFAFIDCYDSAGNLDDPTAFAFLRIGSEDDAYAWADRPTSTTTYTTSTVYSHNPQGNDPTSIKNGTGDYGVTFPGLIVDNGGNVTVTAYGGGSSVKCSISIWSDTTANVICTDDAGNRADSRFDVLYTRFQSCLGEPANVEIGNNLPTGGDDIIAGTSGPDTIFALGGNDIVCGNGGDDFIVGGPGDDTLSGGTGDDEMSGNGGNDFLDGDAGDDSIFAGSGDDLVYGSAGEDLLGGSSGFDEVYGEADDDRINGGSDADGLVDGGSGNDAVNGGGGDDVQVTGNTGNDTVSGNGGNDVITGAAGQDEVRGGPGDDFVFGGADNDFVAGNDGIDTCDGEGGVDTAAGNCEVVISVP